MTIIQDQPATTKANSGQGEGNLLATVLSALTRAGVGETVIEDARRALAAGVVHLPFAQAVRDQHNRDLLPVVDILGELIDRVADQQPLKPIADMIQREQAKEEQAEAGHYLWCSGRCVLQRCDDGTTYFEHYAPAVEVVINDTLGEQVRLDAELATDENLVDDTPSVFLRTGSGNGLMFNSTSLDQAITSFEQFVDGLHNLRRLMAQEKAE
ncbi:hypothetical protein [Streptomyces sp. NPDC127084]|uniref:hypothetical protein n=1 Tax=Streptomyces sp. NPDC127084 TaxID=3347133 RepID=UPI003662535E